MRAEKGRWECQEKDVLGASKAKRKVKDEVYGSCEEGHARDWYDKEMQRQGEMNTHTHTQTHTHKYTER